MQLKRSLKAVLAASVWLLPLQAMAQSTASTAAPTGDNWFTVGGQYQSGGSDYFGRFTGQTHPGLYGLGDFHVNLRDPWNSGGTRYFQADGTDMGLPDRSVTLKAGQQGTWGVVFSYDGIPYYATENFLSVWQPNGALVPGVAPGSLKSTAQAAGLLWNEPLSTQRDIFTAVGTYDWGDWTFTGAIRHDHKHGLQANSLAILGAPAATATALTSDAALGYFAQPIDYDMDRYDASAQYANQRLQVQIGYTFSEFTNNDPVDQLTNPFAFPAGSALGPTGSSPARISSFYTTPPSNSEHQVKLMVGYNLTPTTRLNANFAYGVQMQNAPYEPFNGNGNANLAQYSVPGSSFDGLMQTIFGNIAITSQPLPKLDIRLAYTIDDRSNQSPRNRYAISAVDNATVTTPAGGYYNLPFSYNHQSATADAGYRILPLTKVSVGYRFDDTYRTYSDSSVVIENSEWAQVRSQIIPDLFASLRFTHSDRTAQNYNPNGTWAALCNTCNSEPLGMVLYYLASRTHNEVKSTLDWSPNEQIATSLMVRYASDHYPGSTYGMRDNTNLSVGPDVSYQITSGINAHAYYTFEQIYFNQNSLYASTGTGLGPTGTGYSAPWNLKTTDQTHTAGITVDWQAIPDKLKVSADYNFSYGDTNYALGDGGYLVGGKVSGATLANLIIVPLPDVTAMLNTISIRAEYQLRSNITLIGGYAYERFSYADFAYNVGSTQYVNAFFPGSLKPNFGIHVVGAAMRYRF